MSIKRRDFLKATAGGALALTAGNKPAPAGAEVHEPPADAVGILYDSNLCIGCQSCMWACKEANNMPAEHSGAERLWDNPLDLSATTLNIIKMYQDGDELRFVKRQCFHCLEPACASACPVTALYKDSKTGIVTYDKSACIGCRYCQVVCSFNVPKFEWNSPFPEIRKCELCNHLLARGDDPACCRSCPTGASLFGPVKALQEEAERRLQLTPGEYRYFPVNNLASGQRKRHKVKPYIDHIYGRQELGGTQVMLLAGVDFAHLGLPAFREKSYVSDLEGISRGLYSYMLLPAAVFGGLLYVAKRNSGHE